MNKNKLHAGACLLLAALAGCAAPPAASGKLPPDATLDRIKDEVRAAQREAAKPLPTPDAVERALLPPLAADIAKPPAPPEPRFDLTVSNAPAQQVFLQIVSGTKYSMLVPPEVSGSIAINLKNVTVREALDALRDLYGYEYRVQGTRIFIQPNTLQTRIFAVNYLAGKRRGATDMRVSSGSISAPPSAGIATNGTTTTTTATGPAAGSAVQSSARAQRRVVRLPPTWRCATS